MNDFAGLLQPSEVQSLENKLVAFNDSTSNQIAVVIVNDLQGYDRSEFAYRVAKGLGCGAVRFQQRPAGAGEDKDSLFSGQIFIATGYGLEGAIPDLACADIIDREMLPRFREGDYYGGLDAGTDVLMALASGEYSYESYGQGSGDESFGFVPGIVFLIIIIVLIVVASSGNSNNKHIKKTGAANLPFWLLMSMMGGGRSHGGSWGGFSGGEEVAAAARRLRRLWRRRLRRRRGRRILVEFLTVNFVPQSYAELCLSCTVFISEQIILLCNNSVLLCV